jgi:hypothetical protein
MALHGKSGVVRAAHARSSASVPRTASVASESASTAVQTRVAQKQDTVMLNTAAVSVARARRQALSTAGKAVLQQSANTRPTGRVRPQREAVSDATVRSAGCGCGCNGTKKSCGTDVNTDSAQATVSASTGFQAAVMTQLATPSGGRALARARRTALSQDGKAGLKRVAQAAKIAVSMPGQDWQAAITKGATGRQISMQRRLVQSLAGRTGSSSTAEKTRATGRVRVRDVQAAPDKVEVGHTLSGQTVTGTMTDSLKGVTGNEPGSCRAITGTEYVGNEQFVSVCNTRPEPNPPKVGVSSTLREQRVTGTEVGRSERVTGDEPGACRGITGTEYLSAERYAEFCSARPVPPAPKVGVAETAKGRIVSGTTVGRSDKVTGDEPGSDRRLTGTGYMATASLELPSATPRALPVTSRARVVASPAPNTSPPSSTKACAARSPRRIRARSA